MLGRPLSAIRKLKLWVNTSTLVLSLTTSWNGWQNWRNCIEGATAAVSFAKAKLFLCWPEDFNSFLQIFYWECSVILFHLLVSQLGSDEQEQPAKNCPYRLQDNCSAQRDLALFCEQQILRKARSILTKKDHILNQKFTTLPSGCRLRCPICKK